MNDATAIIDASIVYGAQRWLRGVHQQRDWPYRHQYRAADDQRLFLEFLHCLGGSQDEPC